MIVTVTSWRGCGTTTTALAMAAASALDTTAWLVEADPAGGVLAGRIHLGSSALAGLEHLAFPTSYGVDVIDDFESVAHPAGRLRIVAAPADPFRAHACHTPRRDWRAGLCQLDGVVVVDAGRLRASSPVWPLLDLADSVVLVASPEVSAAVASVEWLRSRGRVSPSEPGLEAPALRVAVVDSPSGVAFGRDALERELGSEFGAWVPWDPGSVDLLHRGAPGDDRRLRHAPLLSAAARIMASLPVPEEVRA